mgnify:CR=1 FL=1
MRLIKFDQAIIERQGEYRKDAREMYINCEKIQYMERTPVGVRMLIQDMLAAIIVYGLTMDEVAIRIGGEEE